MILLVFIFKFLAYHNKNLLKQLKHHIMQYNYFYIFENYSEKKNKRVFDGALYTDIFLIKKSNLQNFQITLEKIMYLI